MANKNIVCLVLLLLSLSFAAAITVSTDKTEYTGEGIVTVNISGCTGTSITKFTNPNDDLVDIKSGQGDEGTTYHTSSDSASGKYTVSTSCTNGFSEVNFCVDAPGCLVEEEEECISDWSCGEWSSCGADQLERRTCADTNNCELDKEETQSCTSVCQESWSCLSWSTCQNGIQTRTCYDQNNCGTMLNKPDGQQSCQDSVVQWPAPTKPVAEESFFAKNKGLVIAVVLAVVLLVLGLLYFWKWKGKEASFEEVREWMSTERENGVSDEDIRIALQKRGWEEKDIKAAFKKLK